MRIVYYLAVNTHFERFTTSVIITFILRGNVKEDEHMQKSKTEKREPNKIKTQE